MTAQTSEDLGYDWTEQDTLCCHPATSRALISYKNQLVAMTLTTFICYLKRRFYGARIP